VQRKSSDKQLRITDMRIAIVLDNIQLQETGSRTKKIMLFEADGELIIAVDEDIISLADINYLNLWLLGKRVVKLYCDGLKEEEKAFIERTGVEIYPLAKIRDHPILQGLLLKE